MSELEVRGLVKGHARPGLEPVQVLRGLDLDIAAGETVAVMGISGSGKSTLLHVLGGMLAPDAGVVRVAGVEPWKLDPKRRAAWRNRSVGFVFQHHGLLSELSALENVTLPAWIEGDAGAAGAAAATLLEALGLTQRARHYPGELSGGEAQRVAVARALVLAPLLVLADEPTGNLDRETGERVFDAFLDLTRDRRHVALVATHDEDLARRCTRVLRLEGGRMA